MGGKVEEVESCLPEDEPTQRPQTEAPYEDMAVTWIRGLLQQTMGQGGLPTS